jgi:hypothetical protein
MCLVPLMGMTGIMKNAVMNCIPFLMMKFATVPHCPQRICCEDGCEPQVKNRVPMIKKKNVACSF